MTFVLSTLAYLSPFASADDLDPFPEDEIPLLAAESLVATIDGNDVVLEWTAPQSRVNTWIVSLNSKPVASVNADVHSAIVRDVDRTKSAVFSVIPVDRNGIQGPACITYLEPISTIPPFELAEEVTGDTGEVELPHGVEIESDTGWNDAGERSITVAPREGLSFSEGQTETFTLHRAQETANGPSSEQSDSPETEASPNEPQSTVDSVAAPL